MFMIDVIGRLSRSYGLGNVNNSAVPMDVLMSEILYSAGGDYRFARVLTITDCTRQEALGLGPHMNKR